MKSSNSKTRVVVGLSGGVDSSVTAKLLVDQGYDVVGVFMKNWDDADDPHCPAATDALDARHVADHLGIPFFTFNFAKEYWRDVFDYFLQQHKQFRTPNPDILCNQFIKFKVFLDAAEKLGAQKIATGHYAANQWNFDTECWELQVPKDANKDQTYFLYTLGQEALSKTLFPLSDLTKPEIRQMAKDAGFHNAGKKDSTGICFVGERDYLEFLKKYLHQEPGDIVTESGQVLGQHVGLSFYTIGQRKNLNIGGVKGAQEAPWFVLAKDIEHNQIVVCQNDDNPRLFQTELTANRLSWVSGKAPLQKGGVGGFKAGASPLSERGDRGVFSESSNSTKTQPVEFEPNVPGFRCTAKIRYRQDFQPCLISPLEGEIKRGMKGSGTPSSSPQKGESVHVTFDQPQRAITPGQSIVFYNETMKVCLGGGEIC